MSRAGPELAGNTNGFAAAIKPPQPCVTQQRSGTSRSVPDSDAQCCASLLKEQHFGFSGAGAAASAVSGQVTMNKPKHIAAASSCVTSARTSGAYCRAVACQRSPGQLEAGGRGQLLAG
ncbi:MAG: hypothetical protein AVDCRST_MAG42-1179 [uncultured Chthoniobacterales bacterium]|uniref:Uncharacterized protein n=1 Tax=uncultured Chthoniobacterales bacterium TaxID=1836801 RepID=A0A6J4HS87_9BACT|nr:MAG: hypothetical protein AVDCRST_MAG42-1179 [uncultured Chthoniobacterales bacterium]